MPNKAQSMKHCNSALEQQLCTETNCADVNKAAEKYIEHVRTNLSLEQTTDLYKWAAALNISSISKEDIPFEGLLRPINEREYTITVNKFKAQTRQNFSIAHEMGHVLLHQLEPRTRSFETRSVFHPVGGKSEERLCNRFASAILMPQEQTLSMWIPKRPLSTAKKISRHFRVSLSASTRRLTELKEVEVSTLFTDISDRQLKIDKILSNFRNWPLSTGDLIRPCNTLTNHKRGANYIGWAWAGNHISKQRVWIETEKQDNKTLVSLAKTAQACNK